MSTPPPEPGSFYDAVGGAPSFRRLVEHFYAGVAGDEVLRPLYPDEDLGAAADRLRMFLEQYWGGPTTYSEQRGHPRLRMRHAAFAVTLTARDHWLDRMREAVDALALREDLDRQLWAYLTMAADSLVNTDEPATAGDPAGTESPDPGADPTPRGDAMPTFRPTHLTLPTVNR